ncbi:MAG: helix-turn-helix transcriptional regulator [Ruminococcaceae bacterium]|nr:helix-turn-helix transcriptional regulator [Oscillospiraceae bacterium]
MDYEKSLIDINEKLAASKTMYSLICVKASALTITLNETRCYLDGYYLLCLNISDRLNVNSGSYEALNMQFRPYFYNVNLNHNVIGLDMYTEMREKYGYPDFHLFRERNDTYLGILTLNRDEYEMIKLHYSTSQMHISKHGIDGMWSCRTRSEMISILRIAEGANFGEFEDKGYTILRYIRDNIASDLSLSSLSKHFNTNRTTLARIIKELTAMSPMQYVMEERLNQSRPDLLFTYVSIADIATKYGFADMNYYVRAFKKRYGKTPHQYRTEGREERIRNEGIYHKREEILKERSENEKWAYEKKNKGYFVNGQLYGYGISLHVYIPGANDQSITEFEEFLIETTPYKGKNSFAMPISECDGLLCDICSKGDEVGGTIFLIENGKSNTEFPWRNAQDNSLITKIIVDPEYRAPLSKCLKKLISYSPYRKLYVHIRQTELNNVTGILSTDEFIKLMNEDKLCGNMIYIIYDEMPSTIHFPGDIENLISDISDYDILTQYAKADMENHPTFSQQYFTLEAVVIETAKGNIYHSVLDWKNEEETDALLSQLQNNEDREISRYICMFGITDYQMGYVEFRRKLIKLHENNGNAETILTSDGGYVKKKLKDLL